MRYFLSTLALLIVVFGYSQTTVTGTLVDTLGKPLSGASVVLLQQADSTLVQFGLSQDNGAFQLKQVPTGEYLLRFDYLGFQRPDDSLRIKADDQLLGLGELRMYPEGYALRTVEVSGLRIPVRMRGDTILFDADAFATGPNAVVEDLLRRLPGMSVDPFGNLRFQGKSIREVMINGEPFFQGNNRLLTQNLPADAVSSVEVFDKKSDAEEISGVDDGQEATTINLELKEGKEDVLFGQVAAGYGSADRYGADAKLFRAGQKSQLGLIGRLNNVNETGFSVMDMIEFQGGMNGGSIQIGSGDDAALPFGNDNEGENRAGTLALNYSRKLGDRLRAQGSYLLYDLRQDVGRSIDEAFLDSDRRNRRFQNSTRQRSRHRAQVNLRYKRDTTERWSLEGLIFATDDTFADAETTDLLKGTSLLTQIRQTESQTTNQFRGRLGGSYNRRLGRPGRTLDASGSYAFTDGDEGLLLETTGLVDTVDLVGAPRNGNQQLDQTILQGDWDGRIGITESFSERSRLQFFGALGSQRQERRFDLDGNPINTLPERTWNTQGLGLEWTLRFGEEHQLAIGGEWRNTSLRFPDPEGRPSVDQAYWLPQFRLQLSGDNRQFNLRLRANPQAPDLRQLQAVADPARPDLVQIGNTDLRPELRYTLSEDLFYFDQFHGLNLFANAQTSYIRDAFAASVILDDGVQQFQTINTAAAWQHNAFLNFGVRLPVAKLKTELRLQFFQRSGISLLNGSERDSRRTNWSPDLSLVREFSTDSRVRLGASAQFDRNRFQIDERTDRINTRSTDWYAELDWEISGHWRVETRLAYRRYFSSSFSQAADLPVAGLVLEYRPRGGKLYFSASAQDLFNQNLTINRSTLDYLTRETRATNLGRYLLVKAHYKI